MNAAANARTESRTTQKTNDGASVAEIFNAAVAFAAAICVAVWGNANGAAKVGETVEAERTERVAPSGERGEVADANGFNVLALR